MHERKPRKPKNYGQKPLPGLEGEIEAEAVKNEQPIGMPPLKMVKSYAASLGLTDQDAEHIYDIWLMNGFTLKTGAKIRSWQAAIRIWQRNEFFPSQKKAAAAMAKLDADAEGRKAALKRRKEGK